MGYPVPLAILQATGSTLWWDEEAAQIRFEVIIPFLIMADVPIFNETQHIIADSAQVEDEEDERVSRVSTYFKLSSVIDDVDKETLKP